MCERDYVGRQKVRDSGARLALFIANHCLGTNWDPLRTTLISSEVMCPSDLITNH
jgi:hypothetical protein